MTDGTFLSNSQRWYRSDFFSEKKGGPDLLGGKSVSFIRDYNKLVKL